MGGDLTPAELDELLAAYALDAVDGDERALVEGWIARTPRAVGDAVHTRLLELLEAGRIRPIVGREVDFADLPAALDAMEDRATIGRVVVHVAAATGGAT